MSFTDFKEIGVDNPGTSIRYGGDDLKGIMQILNGKTIASKRPRIKSEWLWLDHFDIAPPATTPTAPTEPNSTRLFVDPVNFRLRVKKTDGTAIDIENLDIPNDSIQQITDRGKLPASLLYNDQDNTLGTHYLDVGWIMEPSAPAADTCRLFCDEMTGELTVMHPDGMMMSLEAVGMHPLDSLADVNIPTPVHNDVLTWDSSTGEWKSAAPPGLGGGEANVGDNIGTAGIGIYKQKSGVVLQLKKLNAITAGNILLTDDTTNDKIDVDIGPNVVATDQPNTYDAGQAQTFPTLTMSIGAPTTGFSYTIAGSEITGNRTLTLPLLGTTDTIVTQAHAQTLTNKVIDAANNTISSIGDAQLAAHTTTKISIANRLLLPSSIAYEDEPNNFVQGQTFSNFIDINTIGVPADQTATGVGRAYVKTLDANNEALCVKLKVAGVIQEVILGP